MIVFGTNMRVQTPYGPGIIVDTKLEHGRILYLIEHEVSASYDVGKAPVDSTDWHEGGNLRMLKDQTPYGATKEV